MTDDLKRIKQLEKETGIKLDQRQGTYPHIIGYKNNGFSINEKGEVIRLNLDRIELSSPSLKTISTFLHLEKLSLVSTKIMDISSLLELSHLTTLSLRNNRITSISSLQKLSHLTSLDLGGNKITDISSLKGLIQLTTVDLGENLITDISSLKGMSQLTTLNLRNNQITDISSLQGLSHLTSLDLDGNQVTDISSLQGLIQLTTLDLGENQIKDIISLKGLIQLATLNLRNNQITDISSLQGLSHLTSLDLRENQIKDINSLKTLTHLQYLNLWNNKIRQLPTTVIGLGLDIDVKSEVASIAEKKIFLRGNPMEEPPLEIIRQGKSAMRAYFQSLVGMRQSLNEVKVLLVGDGGSGKTSLVKRLLKKGFDQNEDQTHGINIKPWTVNQDDNTIKVNIWDFGGQEIMHATHQFFLSKRSLYILVLDSRKDEKTEYWLKLIESFGGNSPVLVALNKMDQHPGFDVNRLFLQKKYKNIKGFFRVSCAKDQGIKKFSVVLTRELANVEMIRTTWAATWFNVKKQMENLPQPYIDYEEYRVLCEKERIPETASQETLLEFLNDLGVALHFKDYELQNTHVLEPRWVTSAVYKIINSAELAESRGVLRLEQLDNILKKQNEDDYHYPRHKYRYIIGLMQKFELCYPIDDRLCLIPDLLAVQEPELDMDNPAALKFILQYDFLPRSIIPRFIVNMHKDIKGGLQWRTGVVLEDRDFQATAVVKADHEARRVYLHVTGEQRRDYFAVLLAVLRRIHRSFETLKTRELIPMPDNPDITAEYKQLLQFEKQGIPIYPTGEPGKVYKVDDLLGTITSAQETETEILGQLEKIKEILLALESEKNPRESMLKAANEIFEFKVKTPIGDIKPGKLVEKLFSKSKKPKPPT